MGRGCDATSRAKIKNPIFECLQTGITFFVSKLFACNRVTVEVLTDDMNYIIIQFTSKQTKQNKHTQRNEKKKKNKKRTKKIYTYSRANVAKDRRKGETDKTGKGRKKNKNKNKNTNSENLTCYRCFRCCIVTLCRELKHSK